MESAVLFIITYTDYASLVTVKGRTVGRGVCLLQSRGCVLEPSRGSRLSVRVQSLFLHSVRSSAWTLELSFLYLQMVCLLLTRKRLQGALLCPLCHFALKPLGSRPVLGTGGGQGSIVQEEGSFRGCGAGSRCRCPRTLAFSGTRRY